MREGRRKDAADAAEFFVSKRDAFVRELVGVLARYLSDMGDLHEKKGRPLQRFDFKFAAALHPTLWLFERAVACRDLVDGRNLSPKKLAWLAASLGVVSDIDSAPDDGYDDKIAQIAKRAAEDLDGFRQTMIKPAQKILRDLRLDEKIVGRQKFRATARLRIEEITGVSLEKSNRKLRR